MQAKVFYALIATMCLGAMVYGQTTVKGKLIDINGKDLNNINLTVGKHSTKSDNYGRFELYVPESSAFELVLSAVGYKLETMKISPKGSVTVLPTIVVYRSEHAIDQIEVQGYSSLNKTVLLVGKGGILDKDLPQAVQVINAQVIKDQQINTLGDALKNANGVALGANRGGTGETFYARGESITSGGNNILKNGARTNNGGAIEASTLESVEILKGSAALLYGGVTGGAVINMVTKKPKFELGGEVSMRYGAWDRYKPTLDIYGPLSDKVAFRFIGTGESANSYRDFVKSKRVYVNPAVLYKLSDKTVINFMADYLKSDYTPDFGIGTVGGKINEEVGRGTFLNVPWAYNKTNSTNGQIAIDHRFSENWKLNVLASLQNYSREYYSSERLNPKDDGIANLTLNRTNTEEFSTHQQINIQGELNTGVIKHQILIGADADQSTTNAYAFYIFADPTKPSLPNTAYGTIDVFNPFRLDRSFIPEVAKNTRTESNINRYGAFIQDLISLSKHVKVLAGVRYTYQHTPLSTKYMYSTGQSEDSGAKYDDKAWSPKFALIYQPLESMSIYGSYTNNFISNTASLDINNQPLGPSIVDHYEAGMKNDFFKGKLSANLTWYKILNNNFAQNVVLPDGSIDSQHKEFTGKTASDGVELDLTGSPWNGLNLMAGYAYNFKRYTSTLAETGSVEGVRLVGTTANTANISAFYTIQNGGVRGLKFGATAFYTGKRNAGWNNSKKNLADGVDRLIAVDPFTTVDLSLGYSVGKLSLLAKVGNITDEFNYYVHENYSVNPIPPRNFMTTISYKF